MRKVFCIMAFLSFMFLLGTVGALEHDMIPIGSGMIRMAVGSAALWMFTWLSGGFEPYTFGADEESRPRCSRPKGGKRKSSL